MDSKEVKNLMEAYIDVYASEKELNSEGFELWVNALLDEGYDLSDYTWDEVYEAYAELLEANSGYNMDRINKDPFAAMTPATFLKPKEPGQQFASPRRKGPGGGRIPPSMAPSRTAAAVADITRGSERNISASRRLPKEPKTTKMVKKDGKWVKVEEAFDFVLAHLVSEGYADNFDSAIKIMVNMSEEWRNEILDEAYVDWRRGKLPSGRTPQQAAKGRESALKARQKKDEVLGKAFNPQTYKQKGRLSKQSDTVSQMNRSTTLGSRFPIHGNPGIVRGEPNTGRHQSAITKRDAIKASKEADKKTRG